jgi:hypothetical protein
MSNDLKQAAQQALEALESGLDVDPIFAGETITALRTALEQPEQEPVETYIHHYRSQSHPNDFGIPKGHWWQAKQYADAVNTTPPQRPWVELAASTILNLMPSSIPAEHDGALMEFAQAIEAKLKERNG